MAIRKEQQLTSLKAFTGIKRYPTPSIQLFPTPESLTDYLQSRFILVSDCYLDTYEKEVVTLDQIIALITHLGHLPSDMELTFDELTK